MNKVRFTYELIIGVLKQVEGGTQASGGTRLREIERANGKLKKLLAEARLHIEAQRVGFGVNR